MEIYQEIRRLKVKLLELDEMPYFKNKHREIKRINIKLRNLNKRKRYLLCKKEAS